jgi:hypothetical protein
VVDQDKRLRSVISSLEDCRLRLAGSANRDAAQLIGMAILQLRMRLHHIADSELKALCDALTQAKPDSDLNEASGCSAS